MRCRLGGRDFNELKSTVFCDIIQIKEITMEGIDASKLLEAMKARRSVRKYTDEAVSKADIEKVIEAGLWAPSGMGRQATKIIAVTNKALRDRLCAMNAKVIGAAKDPFYGANTVLVVLCKNDCPTGVYDGSLVMGNMMLMASALGLGCCWIHRAREEFESAEGKQILKELGISSEWTGVGHCILGHSADTPAPAARTDGRVVWAE